MCSPSDRSSPPLSLDRPVELRISLKQVDGDWVGEVRWNDDEWAQVYAATRGRALDLIAGYVRAA